MSVNNNPIRPGSAINEFQSLIGGTLEKKPSPASSFGDTYKNGSVTKAPATSAADASKYFAPPKQVG